jgi:hypothetical protein
MIYLTNDEFDQAVYFEVRKSEPRRRAGGTEHVLSGLLGNGVTEVPVTVRSWCDWVEVVFGREDMFRFVEERTLRRMLGAVAREMPLH